tara:strand:- start:130 stop:1224 length:1095 start_codon:yes stop_codon:yes gene_type:complete
MKINKTSLSIVLLSISLNFWSCNSTVEYTSAKMAMQQENWDEAEKHLLDALVVEPENGEVMAQIGYHVHARKKDWKKMNKMFDNAIQINPEANIEISGLSRGPVQDVIDKARTLYWGDNYNKGIKKYQKYRKTKDKSLLESALEIFNEAVLIYPSKPQTYNAMSTCYNALGDNTSAMEAAKMAQQLDPENFQNNFLLAQILYISGNKKDALAYYQKSVEIDPSNPDAVKNLAVSYFENGQKEKSLEAFENALIQTPDDSVNVKAEIYFNLGVLYMQLEQFEEAEDSFYYAYDFNPNDQEAVYLMAVTFENAKKWRSARKFYKKSIEIDPENPEPYKGMSRVMLRLENPDEAREYLKKAKRLGGQ